MLVEPLASISLSLTYTLMDLALAGWHRSGSAQAHPLLVVTAVFAGIPRRFSWPNRCGSWGAVHMLSAARLLAHLPASGR